ADRVILRLLTGIEQGLEQSHLGQSVAEALIQNRTSLLRKVRSAHPTEGLAPSIARLVGVDTLIERAEEHTYDAIVAFLKSPEVDMAIQDAMKSALADVRKGVSERR
ncbi:MAG: hypothetical protein HY261_00680, partial [Chloroflexi bacterium]|nr:hypothetical protein [Chloroflexota bacterium]